MEAVDFFDVIELAGSGDVASAPDGSFFFSRLKYELHCAVELALHGLEDSGSAEKDGHVAVVAACVHDAFVFRSKGQACQFGDGEGIHVGSEGYGLAGKIAFDSPKDCRPEEACFEGDAEFSEDLLDIKGSLFFFSGHFRIFMEVSSPSHHLWQDLRCFSLTSFSYIPRTSFLWHKCMFMQYCINDIRRICGLFPSNLNF